MAPSTQGACLSEKTGMLKGWLYVTQWHLGFLGRANLPVTCRLGVGRVALPEEEGSP